MTPSSGPASARDRIDTFDGFAERLEANARAQRALDAERLSILSEAVAYTQAFPQGTPRELEYRAMRSELAAALRVSEYRIEREMSLAFELLDRFPTVAVSLEEGEIDLQHARAIVEAGCVVGALAHEGYGGAESREQYEQYAAAALEVAKRETPNRLKPIARRLAEQYAVTSLDERHRRAARARAVFVVDRDDGMADLIAHLPAPEAYAIKDRLTWIAREVTRCRGDATGCTDAIGTTGEQRTSDEIRADVLRDLLLAESALDGIPVAAVRAQIQLIIPASLEGVSELVGYGPVGTAAALEYAAEAKHWERVTARTGSDPESYSEPEQEPRTHEVLAVDRYRPSEQMRRLLVVRDKHCRFPGCRVPTSRCDIDHTVDAAFGGPTATDNLAHLCRGHHTLKHHGGWMVRQHAGGVLEWTSPGGRRYRDRPPEPLPVVELPVVDTSPLPLPRAGRPGPRFEPVRADITLPTRLQEAA